MRGSMSASGYPASVGPLLTEPQSRPFPIGWEQDPRIDDGHRHEWEVVMLGPPGHPRVEEVVRCSVCHCPRCGFTYDPNPCMLRRHHRVDHEYANGGKERVG